MTATIDIKTQFVDSQTVVISTMESQLETTTVQGLTATVYDTPNYGSSPEQGVGTVVGTYVDSNGIEENFDANPPLDQTETFQIKYEGTWTPTYTGQQWIYAPGDDGITIDLNGTRVINDWFDKGGGGSATPVQTEAGTPIDFVLWFYENGGGANVWLYHYIEGLMWNWEIIPGSEFTTISYNPQQLAALKTEKDKKSVAQSQLVSLKNEKSDLQDQISTLSSNLETETATLEDIQMQYAEAETATATAKSNLDSAINNMNSSVNTMQQLFVRTKNEEEAARQAAILAAQKPVYDPPAPPAEETPVEQPPTEEPPIEQPPVEEPPVEEPPTEEPPSVDPPVEEPPVVDPVEEPVVEKPVVEKPVIEKPVEKSPEQIVENTIKDAKADGKVTEEEKAAIAEALVSSLAPGEALSAEQIKEAGIDYKDLPPQTPVDVRTDENGNAVVITAEVAANLELISDPAAFVGELLSNPGAALAALGSIGADMSPAEREEATKMVVATVVAAGAALNALGAAGGGAPSGGGNSGGSSGGSGRGNSGGTRRNERW